MKLFICPLIGLLALSCSKPLSSNKPSGLGMTTEQSPTIPGITEDHPFIDGNPATSSTIPGCSSNLSGYYSGIGFHPYPTVALDVSSLPYGACIEAICHSFGVPNIFHLNSASTGWLGQANYAGPWGNTINTASDSSLYVLKDTGANTVHIQTVTNANADNYSVDIRCHQPNVAVASLISPFVSQKMLNTFNSLPVDFVTLGNAIGLGRAVTADDIDFVNLRTSYDANAPDTAKGICASFKSNAASNLTNYVFSMIKMGNTYSYPMIVRTITHQSLTHYRLYADGAITTINKYDSINHTITGTASTYMNGGGLSATLACSGSGVLACMDHIYSKRGWTSVWTTLATVVLPEVGVAAVMACTVHNCFL